MVFQQKLLQKSIFHCQNDWCRPDDGLAGQFWLLESPLNKVFDYVQWAVNQTQRTNNKRLGTLKNRKKYQGQTKMDKILNQYSLLTSLPYLCSLPDLSERVCQHMISRRLYVRWSRLTASNVISFGTNKDQYICVTLLKGDRKVFAWTRASSQGSQKYPESLSQSLGPDLIGGGWLAFLWQK